MKWGMLFLNNAQPHMRKGKRKTQKDSHAFHIQSSQKKEGVTRVEDKTNKSEDGECVVRCLYRNIRLFGIRSGTWEPFFSSNILRNLSLIFNICGPNLIYVTVLFMFTKLNKK